MEQLTLAQEMEQLSSNALVLAQRYIGVELDFSESSIDQVEGLLDGLRSQLPAAAQWNAEDNNLVVMVSACFGAYIGEVMRRSLGGEWVSPTRIAGAKVALKLRNGSECSPMSRVAARIANGPEDDVAYYFHAIKQQVQA